MCTFKRTPPAFLSSKNFYYEKFCTEPAIADDDADADADVDVDTDADLRRAADESTAECSAADRPEAPSIKKGREPFKTLAERKNGRERATVGDGFESHCQHRGKLLKCQAVLLEDH